MFRILRTAVLAIVCAALLGLAACGSENDVTSAPVSPSDSADDGHEGDDHDDNDHEGDDHEGDDHEGDDHEGDDHEGDDHEGDDHDSAGGLGAHVHGVAELFVATSDGDLVMDLVSPTHNIFGFEHEPVTDEELDLVAERTEALAGPGVFVINPEAGCELTSEAAIQLEFEGGHAELTASWLFSCEHPDEINQLDTAGLFAEFPSLEDVDAQWVSASAQSAAELSPSATVLDLG